MEQSELGRGPEQASPGTHNWHQNSVTGFPLPVQALSGVTICLLGGPGVADKLYVCLKAAGGSYSWKLIATG